MSADPALTPCAPRHVRMDAITAKAERLFMALARHHQEPLLKALCKPVLLEQCELLTGLMQRRVKRFGLAGFLRVTFREVHGRKCILHVGTHSAADRFAKHYDGNIPNHIIPIEESIIMKPAQVVSNGNGHHKNGAAVPLPRQEVSRDLANEGDLLVQAIVLIADKAMDEKKRQLVGDIEAMGDLVRGQVEEAINAQIADLVRRQETFEQSMAQQFAQFADQTRRFEGEMAKKDQLAMDLGVQLGEMNVGLGNRVRAVKEEQAVLTKCLGQLQAAQEDWKLQCQENARKVEERLAELSGRLVQDSEFANERDESLRVLEGRVQVMETQLAHAQVTEQRLGQAEAAVRTIDARTEGLESGCRELAVSVAGLKSSLDQLSTPEAGRGFVSKILRLFRRG